MSDLLTHPEFLRLALKAQTAFGKAGHMHDNHVLEGKFCVHDMLDMLGAEIDKEKEARHGHEDAH